MTSDWIYKALFHLLLIQLELIQKKKKLFKLTLEVKEVFCDIMVSLTAIMAKKNFSINTQDHQSFCLMNMFNIKEIERLLFLGKF